TTGANPQHGDACGPRCMTVSAQKRFARNSEALHVDLVRDAVARLAEMYTVSGSRGLEEFVIVSILVICLEEIMVHVLSCQLNLHPVKPQGLELQHGESSGGVLQKGVVDFDGDFAAGY